MRLSQRMKDAEDLLETCITELLPTCEKVLTTFTAIRDSHEISNIIDDASTPVTREDIEAILPDILKRQTDKNFARYVRLKGAHSRPDGGKLHHFNSSMVRLKEV